MLKIAFLFRTIVFTFLLLLFSSCASLRNESYESLLPSDINISCRESSCYTGKAKFVYISKIKTICNRNRDICEEVESPTQWYIGKWKNGKRHGLGKMFYEDGSKYDGWWAHDQKDGEGTLVYADGSKYVGWWENDKQDGEGKMFIQKGHKFILIYDGMWKKGKPL